MLERLFYVRILNKRRTLPRYSNNGEKATRRIKASGVRTAWKPFEGSDALCGVRAAGNDVAGKYLSTEVFWKCFVVGGHGLCHIDNQRYLAGMFSFSKEINACIFTAHTLAPLQQHLALTRTLPLPHAHGEGRLARRLVNAGNDGTGIKSTNALLYLVTSSLSSLACAYPPCAARGARKHRTLGANARTFAWVRRTAQKLYQRGVPAYRLHMLAWAVLEHRTRHSL